LSLERLSSGVHIQGKRQNAVKEIESLDVCAMFDLMPCSRGAVVDVRCCTKHKTKNGSKGVVIEHVRHHRIRKQKEEIYGL
jgi:hypothetical protein